MRFYIINVDEFYLYRLYIFVSFKATVEKKFHFEFMPFFDDNIFIMLTISAQMAIVSYAMFHFFFNNTNST